MASDANCRRRSRHCPQVGRIWAPASAAAQLRHGRCPCDLVAAVLLEPWQRSRWRGRGRWELFICRRGRAWFAGASRQLGRPSHRWQSALGGVAGGKAVAGLAAAVVRLSLLGPTSICYQRRVGPVLGGLAKLRAVCRRLPPDARLDELWRLFRGRRRSHREWDESDHGELAGIFVLDAGHEPRFGSRRHRREKEDALESHQTCACLGAVLGRGHMA
mmetsp:Transcript_73754/g.240210  ORF Transcript_73754/g.240210 Transcript_73754/m.240210 type:complete len:217 (-) Transcript_73754:1322-1972(-)